MQYGFYHIACLFEVRHLYPVKLGFVSAGLESESYVDYTAFYYNKGAVRIRVLRRFISRMTEVICRAFTGL